MDINDPTSSPFGASFLPALPLGDVEPRGIEPYTEADALAFKDYLIHSNNRYILTSIRRQQMRSILRNPAISYSKEAYPDRKERGKLQNLRVWTLKHFILDDNQIYRKPEVVYGTAYNQRYAACTYDAFELISRTHRGLHHTGMYILLNTTSAI
jgi:hypothetical protein